MDSTKFERLVPGFLDTLPEKVAQIEAQADLSHVRDVVDDLYKHLRSMEGKTSMSRSRGYYHPSSVASEYFCPFEAVQARLKRPLADNKDPRGRLIVTEGSALHDILQGYHRAIYGDAFQPEVPTKDETLHMAGSCDGVLTVEQPFRMVIEYKSISSTTGLPAMGKLAHVLQAHCYEFMLGIGAGMVVYWDKSTNNIVGFPHVFDFQRFQAVIDRILMMEACVQENRMPTPKPHAFCSGCSARDICPSWADKVARRGGGARIHEPYDHHASIAEDLA